MTFSKIIFKYLNLAYKEIIGVIKFPNYYVTNYFKQYDVKTYVDRLIIILVVSLKTHFPV